MMDKAWPEFSACDLCGEKEYGFYVWDKLKKQDVWVCGECIRIHGILVDKEAGMTDLEKARMLALVEERDKLANFADSVRGMILECASDPPFDPLERLWKIYRETFDLVGEPIRGSRHEMEIGVLGSSRHHLRAAIRSFLKSGDREVLVATMDADNMVMDGTTPFCRETAERSRSKLLVQVKELERIREKVRYDIKADVIIKRGGQQWFGMKGSTIAAILGDEVQEKEDDSA